MRDEFQHTRQWLNALRRITSWCTQVIGGQVDDERAAKIMGECEDAMSKIEDSYVNASPENWPYIIRELIDSAEYRGQLQERYDVWMSDVANAFWSYDRVDLVWLMKANGKVYEGVDYDSPIGRACALLTRIRNCMRSLFAMVQELKLEYGLQDKDDYRLGTSFLTICNDIVYVNALEENEEKNNLALPEILDTELAQSVFLKCLEKGWMEKKDDGFVWVGIKDCRGQVAQLAYMCGRIYGYIYGVNGNAGKEFPEEALTKLFGVKKLYNQLVQVHSAQKSQKWRAVIDELFD